MGETTITIQLLIEYGSHKKGDVITLPTYQALELLRGCQATRLKGLPGPRKDRMIHNAMNK